MRKALFLSAILIGGVLCSRVYARLTGVNPTGSKSDIFCVGPSGAEFCVDYLGDLIPTTNNAQDLGTASLEWNSVYAKTLSTSGSLAVPSLTSSAVLTTTPSSTGQIIYNSSVTSLCVSTGTAQGAFGLTKSTGTACQ